MFPRIVMIVSLLVIGAAAIYRFRSERDVRPAPVAAAQPGQGVSISAVHPGGANPDESPSPPGYIEDAAHVNQGQQLYHAFNCAGCHAEGGGAIGPALMDDKWVYGSSPRAIYETILEGRPNGMPSFRGKISDDQVWALVAYVRSLSGLVPASIRSSRSDHMQSTPPQTLEEPQPPRDETAPPQ